MRYRKLDAKGDRVFGGNANAFYINIPEAPAQAVATRLRLGTGEWFLNLDDGTPWSTQVLGNNTSGTRDVVIKSRVVGTPGVSDFTDYSSSLDATRRFSVQMTIDTIYGTAIVTGLL